MQVDGTAVGRPGGSPEAVSGPTCGSVLLECMEGDVSEGRQWLDSRTTTGTLVRILLHPAPSGRHWWRAFSL